MSLSAMKKLELAVERLTEDVDWIKKLLLLATGCSITATLTVFGQLLLRR